MKPSLEAFQDACPQVDPRLLAEHLSRLDDRYFSRFSEPQIHEHVKALSLVSPEHPVQLLLRNPRNGEIECTVLGFDYPGVFSLITGILTGMGLSIISGDVFTYQPASKAKGSAPRKRARQPRTEHGHLWRRRIVNHFSGEAAHLRAFEPWAAELRKNTEETFSLLEKGDSQSRETAMNRVNEMVVNRLGHLQPETLPALYPVFIEVDNSGETATRLKILSEDTPAFLYSLTHAFSLHGIIIEHVSIRTRDGRIEDEIDVLDASNRKIEDPDVLDRIKLSVLLTKEFTYFLGKAPDPYAALRRFKHMIEDILRLPGKEQWLEALSDPHSLKDLAVLLGTSDYLWEDFIRLQYETLLPILKPMVAGRRFSQVKETLAQRLEQALKGATTLEEQRERLNKFKDQEIFLIDLDHILNPDFGFRTLAKRLTRLAELVVSVAVQIAYDHLVERFGRPETAAGLAASYAVLGQGKLGGAALGYASDIEFLLAYSDKGSTGGENSVPNSEFFSRMVLSARQLIQAKREGIFHVDLRLRPHGESGPLACSLDSFCDYYGRGGPAHAYERLALVRLRTIAGDKTLGARIERLRDEMVYVSQDINLDDVRQLRQKQFKEKSQKGKRNAKFSPGGLVDLEYNVQILQVQHGKTIPELRTPKIHKALFTFADAGVLSREETGQLFAAYDFLRLLINSMRMLRGSAQDLFLPPEDSSEFAHLARRMGYGKKPLGPAQQLQIDYEIHTASVRAFAERHFGRTALPGPTQGTVADLVLADSVPEELSEQILSAAGFQDPLRAHTNLRGLAGSGSRQVTFARLSLLAFDILLQTPAPDMALNNWEKFIQALPSPEFHYHLLLDQPMRLEILLNVLAGSQFLADTLIRHPGFLDWLIMPENLHQVRDNNALMEELETSFPYPTAHMKWLNKFRRFRRREILRIGTRDMVLKVSTEDVMLELSALAEVLTEHTMKGTFARGKEEERFPQNMEELENKFCILAFGKLGGNELNYSSDIDLMGIFAGSDASGTETGSDTETLKRLYAGVMESLSLDLARHTEEGYAYRVDLRLRPYGRAGELVPPLSGVVEYYRNRASLWEIQAALKLRPIAGNISVGRELLDQIRPILLQHRSRKEIVESVEGMRQAAMKKQSRLSGSTMDVKSGAGGIRDVEFLVQGLQLIHGPDHPELLQANTLAALRSLKETELLPEDLALQLGEDYLFLRRVEHCLQILEDRQTHTLPRDQEEQNRLAKRIMGVEKNASDFMKAMKDCCGRVREAYTTQLLVP